MQNYNENAFERYRRRAEVLKNCDVKKTGSFIDNGEQSTTVRVERTQEVVPVAMVMSHREGADELYVFCHEEEDFRTLDYFVWTDKEEVEHHYFASEQQTIIKDVGYRKLKSFECNVIVNDEFWAYFKGPLLAAKDIGFTRGFEEDKMLPIMICPLRGDLIIGEYVDIEKQKWRILSCDSYSVRGVGFYTMDRAMNENDPEEMPEDEVGMAYIGQTLTLPTFAGYYEVHGNAKLVERTATSVSFKMISSGSVVIVTKNSNENLINNSFVIKENV